MSQRMISYSKLLSFVVMMNEIDDITEKENTFASTINLDDLE